MSFSPFLAPERDLATRVARAKSATNYYTIPGWVPTGAATNSLTNDTDYYGPVMVAAPIVVDQLACEISTGGTGSGRIGLYRANQDWQPIGAPLADSGNIDVTSPAVKTYTPSTPILLQRGRYLTVANSDTGNSTWRLVLGGVPGTSFGTSLGSSPTFRDWRVARTYAAFPTPGTNWDTVTATSTGASSYVVLRVTGP